ncbi:MAG: hypothetical protein PVH87_17725 [Desulfobacteraceae bacterium]|jgi:hypothetical protein
MVNLFNCRSCKPLSLITAGLILLLWCTSVLATQLIDIRVGEYDRFTRVVFELDGPIASPQIETKTSGQLSVTFSKSEPALVRKIPIERSRHVHDIQIWQHQGALSAVVFFDSPHIRFESFPLSSPPRIVVDVFPVTFPAGAESTEALHPEINNQKENNATPANALTDNLVQEADGKADQPIEKASLRKSEIEESQSTKIAEENVQPQLPKQRVSASKASKSPPSRQNGKSAPSRLQFFLVVILVIITIIILILLLLMLLARNRLTNDKYALSAGEHLEHQDKKIADLNSRIKEQFKRYEEV